MNEEIEFITNEGKMTRNEWENDGSNFLQALYNAYKKNQDNFFPYFTHYTSQVINIFKS